MKNSEVAEKDRIYAKLGFSPSPLTGESWGEGGDIGISLCFY
jgi:hypothetical protein